MSVEQSRATLSRELSDFLIQLSIAIHRYAMYPEGHPSLGPTVDNLVERLTGLLQERTQLSLGVARNQLVIEGVATEPANPVLRELAGRLHRHHLGAVTFTRGVGFDELHEVLDLIAVEADRSEVPLGLDPTYRIGRWQHVRLYPLTYDRLELVREEGADPDEAEEEETRSARTRAAQLWVGLARAAMAAEQASDAAQDGTGDDAVPDAAAVARAIQTHQRDAAYDQVIVGYMLQIADELKSGQTPESVALRKRVSKMVSTLDGSTLSRLLEMGGDRDQRHRFLLSASEGMAVDAVLGLVQAASTNEGQTISQSMLRMLEKLAKHAEHSRGQRRRVADASMREQIMKLVQDWSLADPNPDAYRKALERIAGSRPIFSVAPDARFLPEPRRIVEMALETDVMGESVRRAVETLAQGPDLPWLLELVTAAQDRRVAGAIRDLLGTPDRLRDVLGRGQVDQATLDGLLSRMDPEQAAGPLLDALAGAESSQTRRLLLARITALGPEIAPEVVARTTDERWYVVRNMLALLAELPAVPEGFDVVPFMDHADARVRREALRILLRNDATRDRAVCLGLADADDRTVRLALTAAGRHCPPAAVPLLVSRATQGTNTDQRAAALTVLAATGAPEALETLLQVAAPRKTLLGTKLPAPTPEYLAALTGLHRFPGDPRARQTLATAARSKRPEVIKAARG